MIDKRQLARIQSNIDILRKRLNAGVEQNNIRTKVSAAAFAPAVAGLAKAVTAASKLTREELAKATPTMEIALAKMRAAVKLAKEQQGQDGIVQQLIATAEAVIAIGESLTTITSFNEEAGKSVGVDDRQAAIDCCKQIYAEQGNQRSLAAVFGTVSGANKSGTDCDEVMALFKSAQQRAELIDHAHPLA